tara:strand:- start:810 stop:1415 length:606 start_codon:yes stop_codon:yes gene_type:complete
MAATFVTQSELRVTLGIGTLYDNAVVEEVCQAAENIIKGHLWFNNTPNIAHSNTATPGGTGTLYFAQPHSFYVGQTVVVQGNAAHHNGSKTITAIDSDSFRSVTYSITYDITGNVAATPYHPVAPYGYVAADTFVDYETVPEVREASLLIAVDIWQSRQLSNAGGVSPDGFTPSPYRMGNTLIARVRGLIANYLNPNGLVG